MGLQVSITTAPSQSPSDGAAATFHRLTLVLDSGVLLLILLLVAAEVTLYQGNPLPRLGLAALVAGAILLLDWLISWAVALSARQAALWLGLRVLLVELFHAIYGDPVVTTFFYLNLVFLASPIWGHRAARLLLLGAGLQFAVRQLWFLAALRQPEDVANGVVYTLVVGLVGTLIWLLLRLAADERDQRRRAEALLTEVESLHEQVVISSAAEERNRIARDIHDSLGHALTGIQLQLEKALRYQERDAAVATQAIRDAQAAARQALADVRESVTTLRESAPVDLRSQLAALQQSAEQAGLRVTVRLEGNAQGYAPLQLTALYRCAQEGLTNVRRHARATAVTIDVGLGADEASLVLHDDGVGFDPAVHRGGFGLRGLEERVGVLGGRLMVQSTPGAGTRLAVSIPRNPVRTLRTSARGEGAGEEHTP